VFEAVRWLAGRGTCCLIATHSQEFLARVDRVRTIRDGELAGG
jgi:ABC-type lipoprotein export system ATPase subunit